MRTRMLIVLAGAAVVGGLCQVVPARADALSDAGLSTGDVQDRVVELVAGGGLSAPPGLNMLGPTARVAVVKAVGAIAMAYAKTKEFRDQYAAWRAQNAPTLSLISKNDMAKQNAITQADFDKDQAQIKNAASDLEKQRSQFKKAGLTDAQINAMIAQVKAQQQAMLAMQAKGQIPSHPQLMTEADRQKQNAARQKDYNDAKAKFDREHPADPNVALRQELQDFLKECSSVNFNAPVKNGDFVNEADRQHDADWKYCYRAGKPAVDAARAIATAWLKQL